MADENYQNVDLDDDNDVVEAHDPKNAEQQSIDSVSAAAKAGPTAKGRKGDKSNSEPMQKAKAGMAMAKEDLDNIKMDFSEDLNALVESEATLSEEFKAKTAVIFEAAVKAKLSEEIDRLEEAYATELQEEVSATKAELVEKVDSYLNYVVETWMEENKLAVQAGLRTEIAENFMSKLKNLFEESYVEVPDSKVDLVDELATANEQLEESYNEAVAKAISLSEELEQYKRSAIIREAATGLAETQIAKLASLVENIDFVDEETFAAKVETIKESYFTKTKKTSELTESFDTEDDNSVQEVSGAMAQYVNAIRKSSK
jgi:hypothetical protein